MKRSWTMMALVLMAGLLAGALAGAQEMPAAAPADEQLNPDPSVGGGADEASIVNRFYISRGFDRRSLPQYGSAVRVDYDQLSFQQKRAVCYYLGSLVSVRFQRYLVGKEWMVLNRGLRDTIRNKVFATLRDFPDLRYFCVKICYRKNFAFPADRNFTWLNVRVISKP